MRRSLLKRVQHQRIGRVRALESDERAKRSQFGRRCANCRALLFDTCKCVGRLTTQCETVGTLLTRPNSRIASPASVEVFILDMTNDQQVSQAVEFISQCSPPGEY